MNQITCDIQGRFHPAARASAGDSESERRGEVAFCGCVALLLFALSGPTTVDAEPEPDEPEIISKYNRHQKKNWHFECADKLLLVQWQCFSDLCD